MPNPLFDALFAPLAGQNRPLLHLAGGDVVSADDLYRLIARYAHVLRAEGVTTGDRVAVQIAKSPEALAF